MIVPAYNEAEFLGRTLERLQKQTYADVELIVVDNNSSDNTSEIAKNYTSLVFTEKKKGYLHAVNRGVKAASGDILTFCDADTLYPPYWVEQIVLAFHQHPDAVAVYGSCKTHDSKPVLNRINGICYTAFLQTSRLLGMDNTSGFNFAFKKDAFLKVGGYDPKYQKMSPDVELGKRLKKEGAIVFVPTIIVESSFRRFKKGGVVQTTSFFLKAWWQMLRGKEPSVSYETYNKDPR